MVADVAPLLERLPLLATNLADMPRRELRTLFESLALEVVFQPADDAVDVGITLYDSGRPVLATARASEDWSAPPAGLEPAARRLEGGCSIP